MYPLGGPKRAISTKIAYNYQNDGAGLGGYVQFN